MNSTPFSFNSASDDYSVNEAPTLILDPDPTGLEPETPAGTLSPLAEPRSPLPHPLQPLASRLTTAPKQIAPNR